MKLTMDRILFATVLLILAVLVGILINEQRVQSHNKFHPVPATANATPTTATPVPPQALVPAMQYH